MTDIDREDGVVPGEDVTMKEPEGPRGTLPSEENLWDEAAGQHCGAFLAAKYVSTTETENCNWNILSLIRK